ncbi:hypothetical protein [Ruminococcus albus]|nr:hypothetical protein [Ruminococcus albus]
MADRILKTFLLIWDHGYTFKQILSDIDAPWVYIHAKERTTEYPVNGT